MHITVVIICVFECKTVQILRSAPARAPACGSSAWPGRLLLSLIVFRRPVLPYLSAPGGANILSTYRLSPLPGTDPDTTLY
ncbi:hypothetical protein RRG08_039881 [Elysia crispata]|uniref:Uncharacterized protein n=1 Tax=Elysia crispata TaxID=231223 RepID=A0AAE0ZX81_9GAST|nr:hypothetical protein RRG08_039881 [Elysia crispata]